MISTMSTRASWRVNGRRQTKPDLLKFKPKTGRSFNLASVYGFQLYERVLCIWMERLNEYNNTERIENAGVVNVLASAVTTYTHMYVDYMKSRAYTDQVNEPQLYI